MPFSYMRGLENAVPMYCLLYVEGIGKAFFVSGVWEIQYYKEEGGNVQYNFVYGGISAIKIFILKYATDLSQEGV